MLEFDFDQSVGFWICTLAHAFQRVMNEELAPHGITFRQVQVLAQLALEGPVSQRELAERIRVEPPTLVGILDRMERDGWIVRRAAPHDRRKKLVAATAAAEPIWSKIVDCAHRVRRQAVAGIPPERLEMLRETLDVMRNNLAAEEQTGDETETFPIDTTAAQSS